MVDKLHLSRELSKIVFFENICYYITKERNHMNDKHYINLLRLPADDMLEYFFINRKDLKDYRVVLFSQKGNHIPQRYDNIISNEISMMTLSPEENFFVFDNNNISDTIFKGKSDVALSACVHFDTQIISYLERIFDDGPKDEYIYNTYSFLRKILINQSIRFYKLSLYDRKWI